MRIEPLNASEHAEDLWAAMRTPGAGDSWTYLGYGPFPTRQDMERQLALLGQSDDPLYFALRDFDADGRTCGWASLLNVVPQHGRIEIGSIWFSPLLQRRRAGTEALILLARYAFQLGYRRLEWKCDAANAASRRAAVRLGYTFEGIHRRHMVVKRRNRDTAWYAIVADEWPGVDAAYAAWLDAGNFDNAGRQRTRLSELTGA